MSLWSERTQISDVDLNNYHLVILDDILEWKKSSKFIWKL